MKTAVIGASGFVGRYLWRKLRASFPDCLGTACSRKDPEFAFFDLRRPDISSLRLAETRHECVVLAAARTGVAECEQDPRGTAAVNVEGTLEAARQIARLGMRLVYLSSDYVFSGRDGPYADDARPSPGTEYGRQKAQVERELPSLAADHLVMRLSKIFGLERGDGTLLDEMAAALATGEEIAAATDQRFCPTLVTDFVNAFAAFQRSGDRGIVNVCSPESCSRHEIACRLAVAMRVARQRVRRIALHDLPSMRQRPLDTTMTCRRLHAVTEMEFTPLAASLERVAANYVERDLRG